MKDIRLEAGQTRLCCSTCWHMCKLGLMVGWAGPVQNAYWPKQDLGLGAGQVRPLHPVHMRALVEVGQAGLGYCTPWQYLGQEEARLNQVVAPTVNAKTGGGHLRLSHSTMCKS